MQCEALMAWYRLAVWSPLKACRLSMGSPKDFALGLQLQTYQQAKATVKFLLAAVASPGQAT